MTERRITKLVAPHAPALAAIILCTALSAFWAFRIPIFEALDEPQHFDYAISIYNAHRLVRTADGPPSLIVSPYTTYLLRASDFRRIAGHSPMHVPPDYGTASFFRALDADAPDIRRQQPGDGKVNYIVRVYPFAFYVLEAIWMRAAATLTGSITALFFAARLLCVLLTGIGLYFNYRTALNLGIGRATSAVLVGAVGLFPMVSMVSSYVQPDDFAYALLSGALFFATRRRDAAPAFGNTLAIGVLLGLLAVTKYQFFLSAAVPIVALALALAICGRVGFARAMALFSALLLPAFLLIAVQHFGVGGGPATASGLLNASAVPVTAAGGAGAVLRYLTASVFHAYLGCFVTGICAAGYWGVIGWGDAPIVIGGPLPETVIRAVISILTVGTTLFVMILVARNLVRLARIARRGRAAAAFALATRDSIFNSYLCFVAIIFTLYAVTNNGIGLSGRHWYPFAFPAFMCFVWYAPRFFARRHRRISAVLATLLLIYSATAGIAAMTAIGNRYYGPDTGRYAVELPRPLGAAPTVGAQWPLQDGTYIFAATQGRSIFARGMPVAVSGAALEATLRGAPQVAVVLDGTRALPVLPRQYLFGIAEATHSIAAGYSGFSASIDTRRLAEGPHVVQAYARASRGGAFAPVAPPREFFVTTERGTLTSTFVRSLKRLSKVRASVEPTASCGATLLLRGRVPARRVSAVWMLASDQPYPARFDSVTRRFSALLPKHDKTSGSPRVTLYGTDASGVTVVRVAEITISHYSAHDATYPLASTADCADPLRELANPS